MPISPKVRPVLTTRASISALRVAEHGAVAGRSWPASRRRAVVAQGDRFAARWAGLTIATAPGIEGMKAYRMTMCGGTRWPGGRNPDDVKVLFLVYPVIVETDEEAFDRHARMVSTPAFVERVLANASINADIDFAQFDLDKLIPKLSEARRRKVCWMSSRAAWQCGKTLRQLAVEKYDGVGDCASSARLDRPRRGWMK